MAELYVVTAMDTEGPIDNPAKRDIMHTWERVDTLIDRLFADDFRRAWPDATGGGVVFSWYILHLTGFATNPFNRPMGYHLVHDHYVARWGEAMRRLGDELYWHYHQPPPSGVGNEWSRDWTHCTEYHNVLARMVLERGFFPVSFRAGGRIEDDDTSAWIDQYFPFDYSSCSGDVDWDRIESDGKRLIDVCDWTQAPDDWSVYHPSSEDYQRAGDQRRWMFRCPDLDSPAHTLTDKDIEKAFARAAGGAPTALAFFEHDRREIVYDKLSDVFTRIAAMGRRFPQVRWRYANAADAARAVTGVADVPAPRFTMTLRPGRRAFITSETRLHGPVPFVCAGTADGREVREVAVHTIGRWKWLTDPLPSGLTRLGVAASSPSGRAGAQAFDIS
jgi:hypothetical protein